jgi:hypothetical protein
MDGRTGWFLYTPPNFVCRGYNNCTWRYSLYTSILYISLQWILSLLFFFHIVQHCINKLMIMWRSLMWLCHACVGSNLIYTAKYIQEIKFWKLFPFFLLLYTIHFRLKLYTSVMFGCWGVVREQILGSALHLLSIFITDKTFIFLTIRVPQTEDYKEHDLLSLLEYPRFLWVRSSFFCVICFWFCLSLFCVLCPMLFVSLDWHSGFPIWFFLTFIYLKT